jgi:hypothetical protein
MSEAITEIFLTVISLLCYNIVHLILFSFIGNSMRALIRLYLLGLNSCARRLYLSHHNAYIVLANKFSVSISYPDVL